jgi:hypothetical protein
VSISGIESLGFDLAFVYEFRVCFGLFPFNNCVSFMRGDRATRTAPCRCPDVSGAPSQLGGPFGLVLWEDFGSVRAREGFEKNKEAIDRSSSGTIPHYIYVSVDRWAIN